MDRKALGLIGSGLLAIGVFMPIVSLPIVGYMTYIDNGRGDGILVLILATVGAVLLFTGRFKGAMFAGIAAVLVLAYSFFNFEVRLWQMREEMAGNPFGGLAELAVNSIQLQWGCVVLIAGAGCLIGAGLKKDAA